MGVERAAAAPAPGMRHAAAATAADAHALVAERGAGHGPAAVDGADDVVVGHEHVVEEHLVELRVARRHLERPDLDALGVHVDRPSS